MEVIYGWLAASGAFALFFIVAAIVRGEFRKEDE